MDVGALVLPVLAAGVGWLSTACAGPPRLLVDRDAGYVSERHGRGTAPPAGLAQRDDDLAFCVAETNRYRARHGKPSLRRSAELEAYAATGLYSNRTKPIAALGASIDFNVRKNWAVRISPDIILEHFGTETREFVSVSGGVVYRIGKKKK